MRQEEDFRGSEEASGQHSAFEREKELWVQNLSWVLFSLTKRSNGERIVITEALLNLVFPYKTSTSSAWASFRITYWITERSVARLITRRFWTWSLSSFLSDFRSYRSRGGHEDQAGACAAIEPFPFIMETYQPTLQAMSAKLNRLKKIMHMTASVDTNVFFFLNLRNVWTLVLESGWAKRTPK